MKLPRIMITAPSSGAGKTMVCCGLLTCLKDRGMKVTAFKCGPDYIDPMFHKEVLGIDSYNLDTFLCGRENTLKIFTRRAGQSKIAVLEGAMGYYDGIGGRVTDASAYDVAKVTDTPAVLLIDGRGISLSIVPHIQGFLAFREEEAKGSHIGGVILNHVSQGQYIRLKELIEGEAFVKVYGYVPEMKELSFESRHLGLKKPSEIENFKEKMKLFCGRLEETIDIDGLIRLAESAPDLPAYTQELPEKKYKVRIGLSRDEAFCFMYQDNLELLKALGAELVTFSPLYDTKLPEDIHGLILCGGYPELYARQLEENELMRGAVRRALENGLPCIAECGGFMYLQEAIEDSKGVYKGAAGVLKGKCFHAGALKRFGYIVLEGGLVFGRDVGKIPAHEFHYYDSEHCGNAFMAKKPLSDRGWECMISTDTLLAGFPHIHYEGNQKVAEAFLEACTFTAQTAGK